MRLVLGLVQHQLHGAAQTALILGDQQHAFACGDAIRHTAPECDGALARQRVHEAHGLTAVDAVDQHVGQLVDLQVVDHVEASHGPGGCGHSRTGSRTRSRLRSGRVFASGYGTSWDGGKHLS